MSAVVSEMLIRIAADTAALRSQMNDAQRAVGDGFDGIKSAATSLRNTLLGVFAGISVAALAEQFVETADAVSQLEARLRNSVGAGQAFADAQATIYRIAQQNNIGLQEATELFTKLNDPVKRLGGTVNDTGGIVEAFALSLRLGGASTQEASAATLQFAQAMASGKLQGDEFRSMAEASPRFMKALAEGMGVPIEKLKEMGSEGKLTADVVGNALLKSLTQLKSEAGNLPDTVSGAFQRIKNDITVAVGELNNNTGLTLGLSGLLETVRTDLLPAIKVELAEAFQAVGEWIARNRETLVQVWETIKTVGGQVWEAAKAFAGMIGYVSELAGKSGAWKVVLESIGLLVAGLQDGFNIIKAAVMWLAGDRAGANAIFEAFKNGQSAVQQYANEVHNAKDRAAAMDAALKNGAISASEHNAEMARLTRAAGEASGGFAKLKPSVAGVTDEQKKAAEAYQKLIDGIEDKIGALAMEEAQQRKLTSAEQLALKTMQDIQQGRIKLTDAQKREVVSKLELLIATEKEAAKNKELIDLKQKVAQHSQKLTDAQWQQVEALRQGNVTLIEQNDQLRLGEAAVRAREIAVLRSQAADLEWQAAMEGGNAALEEQARLLSQRAALIQEGAMLQQAKDTAEEWKRTAESIERSLTDALLRGFESGKDFARVLRDTVVNMFRTLVIRPVIQAVVAPVAGAVTGALGLPSIAQAGEALGGLGGGGTGGLSGILSGISTLSSALGVGLGAGFSSIGAAGLGGWLSAGTSLIGTGTLGGIGAGLGLLGGPIGLAASLLGGGKIFSSLFGRKLKDYGIEGTFGVGDGFEGNRFEFYKGGLFRSDKTKTSALDPQVDRMLTDTFNGIRDSTKQMADALGLNADQIDGFTQKVKISTKGLSEEEITQKLAEQFGSLRGGMIALYADALAPLQKEGETLVQTFDRLMVVQQFREAINPLGGIFSAIAGASIQAQENLIALAGGVENFLKQANDFVSSYYSQAEQAGIAASGLVDKLQQVGIDLVGMGIDTKSEFRALVESIDVSTQQGQEQLAALLQVAPQFAQLANYMTQSNATIQALIDSAPKVEMLEALIDPQQSTATNTESIAAGVEQSNGLLSAIGSKLDGITAIAQSAVAAAQSAAGAASAAAAAAGQAAGSAALAASRPNYTVDVGRAA